ncbi:hypothetical protein [Hymenobacter sp. BRD67]|nr:hypothetical protein [Hymenobacter sp. BRD67]QKG52869.1 hypothetical protein GKZ67_09955 [Hymenobacter sp. BRD67]
MTIGLQARRMPPWPAALAALGLRPTWEERFYGGAIASLVLQASPGPAQ